MLDRSTLPSVQEVLFATSRDVQAIDLTDLLGEVPMADGFVWLSTPHTTGALLVYESDPEMLEDLERVGRELFAPFEPFKHRKNDNPNAAAHLMSSFLGSQLVLPVRDGRPILGTFQRILFLELDGPRDRRLLVAPMSGERV